ncbi:lipase 1 [Immersiella caudata]|uniref:Lipase 1 n=1 Tax=Immersiella caudata TaxID=314043 RepID=A0AA40BV25_9PEZI|nr:lipase 1 [Immersiella caudata]
MVRLGLLLLRVATVTEAIWQFSPDLTVLAQDDDGDGTESYLPLPSTDSWYRAPEGWEEATPGTVFKIRKNAYNVSLVPIANVKEVFQVLFRSTDSLENATWGVTTVFVPHRSQCDSTTSSANCSQGIVSYQLPYDTSCLDASPSFGLQWGEPYGEIGMALGRGWWVSVPDFEGPLASYGANIVAGYITLDSVRAVLAAVPDAFGVKHPRAALWGYSNGASATEAAVEFAPKYAPALKLAGAAIGGLTPSQITSGPMIARTQVSGLLVQGIIGITSQYPKQREYLLTRLHPSGPYNVTEFFWASYMSGWQSLLYYSYVDVFQYFIGGQADLEEPGMAAMFYREGTLGVFGIPDTPLFMYQAVEDDLTPIAETDSLIQNFCEKGSNILYHRNHWGGHNDELTNGRQRSLDFMGTVLGGGDVLEFPSSGCKTVNLTFMQDPQKPIV